MRGWVGVADDEEEVVDIEDERVVDVEVIVEVRRVLGSCWRGCLGLCRLEFGVFELTEA